MVLHNFLSKLRWNDKNKTFLQYFFSFFLGSIECNLSEHPEAQACVGAVGELLIFHLPNTANTSLRLKKDNEYIVLKIQKNKTLYKHEEFVNQYELFTNGIVKLGSATKRHSGDYLLEEFGSNGSLLNILKVHLEIQGRSKLSLECFLERDNC